MAKSRSWQGWTLLGCGAWLLVSLFVLDLMPPTTPAAILVAVCGMVLLVSASEAMVMPDPLEEWIDLVAGIALMSGAFLGDPAASINAVAVGAVVTVCAFTALHRDLHHRA